MSDGVDHQYTDEIYDEMGYLAAWLPSEYREIGDCGPIEGHLFKRERSVRDFGLAFAPGPLGNPIDVDFTSKAGVSVTLQMEGENKRLAPQIPAGKAGVDIQFSRKGGVVLQLRQAKEQSVADLYKLQRDVLDFYVKHSKDWPANYAVVSSVLEAESGTIIVADEKDSHLAVTAEGKLTAGLIDLASASLGLAVTLSNHVSTKILAQQHIRALFRAFRIKKSWLEPAKIDSLGPTEDLSAETLQEIGAPNSPFEWVNQREPTLERFRTESAS